jgi:hypothetical protein
MVFASAHAWCVGTCMFAQVLAVIWFSTGRWLSSAVHVNNSALFLSPQEGFALRGTQVGSRSQESREMCSGCLFAHFRSVLVHQLIRRNITSLCAYIAAMLLSVFLLNVRGQCGLDRTSGVSHGSPLLRRALRQTAKISTVTPYCYCYLPNCISSRYSCPELQI